MNYPKKRFGQHFLTDSHVLEKIVASISPQAKDKLVEIGAGKGVLTKQLIEKLDHLTAIEIDNDLIPYLEILTQDSRKKLKLIHADALKFDYGSLSTHRDSLRIAGNLPYNISTPLIFHLLNHSLLIKDMHFLLQKEVVDRLASPPGNKSYGRLTVMVQYHCSVEKLFSVAPDAFTPPPKVNSAFVRLTPWNNKPDIAENFQFFSLIVRTAFSQRRKMLRKSLANIITADVFESAAIASDKRPETLSVASFVRLSNAVDHRGKY